MITYHEKVVVRSKIQKFADYGLGKVKGNDTIGLALLTLAEMIIRSPTSSYIQRVLVE